MLHIDSLLDALRLARADYAADASELHRNVLQEACTSLIRELEYLVPPRPAVKDLGW